MKNTKKYVSPFQWETNKQGNIRTTLERDGFNVAIHADYDYDHDFCEGRGEFSSKYEDGAVKNPRARYERNVYEWFIPEYPLAERQRDYTSLGYARHDAYLRARKELLEDLLTAGDPQRAGAMAVMVKVTVSYKGIELAEEASYGIEVEDFNDPEIDGIAQEKLDEALDEAKKNLAELRV